MTVAQILVAGSFLFLAIAHSALGEGAILRPLFATEWSTPMPRWAHERILRFAWHLTSMAWIGISALVLDAPLLETIAVLAFCSALVVFVTLPGHLAWPIFLLGGLAALHEADSLPSGLLAAAAVGTVAVLGALAALHVWWAFGGTWGLDAALPTDAKTGERVFPGRALTMLVAAALAGAAGIVALAAAGVGPSIVPVLAAGAAVVFTVRAIGDTRVAGFTKTVRGTRFAEADDQIFTPLCVALALGTTASLLL